MSEQGTHYYQTGNVPVCFHEWVPLPSEPLFPKWRCAKCGQEFSCTLPADNVIRPMYLTTEKESDAT